ncbi:MAG: hypothetical protein RL220_1569, partial [Bacteroidota bacterium]
LNAGIKSALIATALLMACAAQGQKTSPWIKKGDQAKQEGNWPLAYSCYEKAYELDSADFSNTALLAEASRMMKLYDQSKFLYSKLYQKDKGRLYPEGLFWLASMQQLNGEYDEALRNFKKFLRKNKKSTLADDAQMQADACEWAIGYKPPLHPDSSLNIGSPVNTALSEFAPLNDERSNILLITRLNETDSFSIWQFNRKDSVYTLADAPDVKFQDYQSVGSLSFDADSSHVYCTCIPTNTGTRKICRMKYEGGRFLDIEYLSRINNSDSAEFTTPFFANTEQGEILFYASGKKGGRGGWDIWYSLLTDGVPGPPIHAGTVLNTALNEICPFYLDGTMYYASDGYEGFGGYDLHKSSGNTDKGFERPVNLGIPYNSPGNDLYYSFSEKQNAVYFSSNRSDATDDSDDLYPGCCSDIYRVRLKIDSTITAAEKFANLDEVRIELPVRLYFHNDEPDPNTRDSTTAITYTQSYQSYIKLKPKYLTENAKGKSGEEAENSELRTEEFFELYAEQGFEDLQDVRQLILAQLEQGKRLRVYVRGFASPRAQTDYNLSLTKRRVSSLVNDFRSWQGGLFVPYLEGTAVNGGKLEFVARPFGEYKADQRVSDDLFNEKESIYSTGACLERKIEIEAIELIPEAFLSLSRDVIDLGTISASEVRDASVSLKNQGGEKLVIDSVEATCGCTIPELNTFELQPGESTELRIRFDPKGQSGHVSRTVILYLSDGEKREIDLLAEIKEP